MTSPSNMTLTKDMNLNELVDYWTGYICIAIGRGDLRQAVSLILQDTMTFSYEKGRKEGKKSV